MKKVWGNEYFSDIRGNVYQFCENRGKLQILIKRLKLKFRWINKEIYWEKEKFVWKKAN